MAEVDNQVDEKHYQQVEIGAKTYETQNTNFGVMDKFLSEHRNSFLSRPDKENSDYDYYILKDTNYGVYIVHQDRIFLIEGGTDWNLDVMAGKVDIKPIFNCNISDSAVQMRSVGVTAESDKGVKTNVDMPYCAIDINSEYATCLKLICDAIEKEAAKNNDAFEKIIDSDHVTSPIGRFATANLVVEVA